MSTLRRRIGGTFAGALLVICLGTASVAGPVRVWTTPPPGATTQPTGSKGFDTAPEPTPRPERGERTRLVGGETLARVVILLLALLALFALREVGPSLTRQLTGLRKPTRDTDTWKQLPNVELSTEHVDVIAARRLLEGGGPRNAIIRCWIQVQDDLTSVGFRPFESETPSEYVARLVEDESLEFAPIVELAALYTEARFSDHNMTEAHRERAAAVLNRITSRQHAAMDVHQ